jgi:hypothetical protein
MGVFVHKFVGRQSEPIFESDHIVWGQENGHVGAAVGEAFDSGMAFEAKTALEIHLVLVIGFVVLFGHCFSYSVRRPMVGAGCITGYNKRINWYHINAKLSIVGGKFDYGSSGPWPGRPGRGHALNP